MDHDQWVNQRFDAYAEFVGRIDTLARMKHYSAHKLRYKLNQAIIQHDQRLGRIDGTMMDNGSKPADHVP